MALESHPIDGSLATWDEVAPAFEDDPALLLGNGLSKHVWGDFGYPSLFEEAPRGERPGSLTDEDLGLFEVLETTNFERVLAELAAAIQMAEALDVKSERFVERYLNIQLALGYAVRRVHAGYGDIADGALEAIGRVLQDQRLVFTTSYDLIVYWAMRAVKFKRLCDCFWTDDHIFDPTNTEPPPSLAPVYFLHGGLHLVAIGSGRTRKFVSGGQTLLHQFKEMLDAEGESGLPLLVTEGPWQFKLQAIEENDYLDHAFEQLGECDSPLVVFGSRLSKGDRHLVEAINRNPDRPVAVSLYVEGKRENEIRAAKGALRASLDASRLFFFDASTHPLGAPELSGRGPW